jgi:uncharacterized membrane protein YkvA (DUF1232 family)
VVSGQLVQALRGFAQNQGLRPKPKDIQGVATFVREYMEHVPMLLDKIAAAANRAGIASMVLPMLEQVEQYWHEPNDLIPDSLGVLGLMDDVYYSMWLIQSSSQSHQARTGNGLIPQDYTVANRFMRVLVGDQPVSILDAAFAGILQQPALAGSLAKLVTFQASLPVPDPIWGNASIDEIVKIRLGPMGIF